VPRGCIRRRPSPRSPAAGPDGGSGPGSSLVTVSGWPLPLLASDVAFAVVFGVFVAALAVLGFVAIRWGVRKDRPGRAEWRRRYEEAAGRQGANGSNPGFGDGPSSPTAAGDQS
jgi:hypothetical protein